MRCSTQVREQSRGQRPDAQFALLRGPAPSWEQERVIRLPLRRERPMSSGLRIFRLTLWRCRSDLDRNCGVGSGGAGTEQCGGEAQRIGPGEIAGRFFPSGDADWFEFQPDVAGEWLLR